MSTTKPAVQVEGLRELTAKLRLLDAEAPKKIKALNKAEAEKVVPPARTLAETLFIAPSGQLADTVRAGATARAGYIVAGSNAVPYAGVQHFGWPKHNVKEHPFLTEALGGNEQLIVDDYETGIGGLIAKVGLE